MSNEIQIIEIPEEKALDIFCETNGLDPYLESVFKQARALVPDLTTNKGRKEIASTAFKVSESKSLIEKIGKKIADDVKQKPKLVDAERRRVKKLLEDLRDEVRQPLTDWENAEKERIDNIESRIVTFSSHKEVAFTNSGEVEAHIDWLKSVEIKGNFDEFEAKAIIARDDAVAWMQKLLESTLEQEAKDAELERLRLESIERDRLENEARIAREATEAAQRKADQEAEDLRLAVEIKAQAEREEAQERENQLRLENERVESEKLKAEQRAEHEAEQQRIETERQAQVERDAAEKRELQLTLEKERAEKAIVLAQREAEQAVKNANAELERKAEQERQEAIKREADTKHRKKINNAALTALSKLGLTEEQSKSVVTAIAKGQIPNVRISY